MGGKKLKIEQIAENKLRIILNNKDLQKNNIDLHSFMSNSPETQALFYAVLDKAEKEIGFNTKDYKLIVEALAIANETFILNVTRICSENKEKIQSKTKRESINEISNIYMFNTFNEYLDFCSFLNKFLKNIYSFLKKSTLYLYNSKYYLCLHITNKDIEKLKHIQYLIVEFAHTVTNSDLFEEKLKESGKVIFNKNAIDNTIKTFL